jgi:hypothetical protein
MRMPFLSQILAIRILAIRYMNGVDEGRQHVCNFSQLIRNIRYVGLSQLLGMKVEIYQLPTLPTSLRTSSPTSGGPLVPSGSLSSYHVQR